MDFHFVVSWQKMLVKVLKHMEASKGHNNICAARLRAILLWDENGFNRVVASVQFKLFLVLLALNIRILELSGQELEMDVHKEPCIDYYQTCQ